jgi:hypothetical protein
MSETTLRQKIEEYINLLKDDEYINIKAAMTNEVTKNRLLQTIEERLVKYNTAKSNDIVQAIGYIFQAIELEMYDEE